MTPWISAGSSAFRRHRRKQFRQAEGGPAVSGQRLENGAGCVQRLFPGVVRGGPCPSVSTPRHSKHSGQGIFFSLPNKGFLLGLNAGKLSVYSFPRRCESQKAHQCWFSIRTIGEAVGMNEHTVRKHIWQLKKYELAAERRMWRSTGGSWKAPHDRL